MIYGEGIHELPADSKTSTRVAILVDDSGRIVKVREYTPGEAAETFRELWHEHDKTAKRMRGWIQYERMTKRAVRWDSNALMFARIERKRQAKIQRQAAAAGRTRKAA